VQAAVAVGPQDNEKVRFTFAEVMGGVEGFDQPVGSGAGAAGADFLSVSVFRVLRDLGAPAIIDYMSFDIEGAEWWVFSTFPRESYTFLSKTIERPSTELRNKLFEVGYHYLCTHGTFGDELFVHHTIPEFSNILGQFGRSQCRQ
jgi:hypothetical protein